MVSRLLYMHRVFNTTAAKFVLYIYSKFLAESGTSDSFFRSYFILSLMTAIFCNIPIGIVAVVFSTQVST